jgi:alpha-tubulin suppressor-like RCC1 family protein
MSAGFTHTLAVKNNGSLWTWGYNFYGQLGDGTTGDHGYPLPIGASTWTQVAAGGHQSAGIRSDGSLWTWGFNLNCELGQGTCGTSTSTPGQVNPGSTWKSVTGGANHTLAIASNDTLWAWGNNSLGQLGYTGCAGSCLTPTQVGAGKWLAVSAGYDHTLAIAANGTLWAWGGNTYGQVGNSAAGTDQPTPTQIGGASAWKAVAGGYYHSLAIRADGTLWAWGYNSSGQLGLGDSLPRAIPVPVGTATDWAAVAGGNSRSVALKNDGTRWGWGYNGSGELGAGDTSSSSVPRSASISANWSRLGTMALAGHGLAMTSDGSLWTWGYNFYGEVGDGTIANRTVPYQILP